MISSDWQSQIFEKKKKEKEKKKDDPNLGPTGLNQTPNQVFCHILEFGSLVLQLKLHAMIAWNNFILEVNNRGKTHKKSFGDPSLGKNQAWN